MLRAVPSRRCLLLAVCLIASVASCPRAGARRPASLVPGADAGEDSRGSPDGEATDSGSDDASVTEVDSWSPAVEASAPSTRVPAAVDAGRRGFGVRGARARRARTARRASAASRAAASGTTWRARGRLHGRADACRSTRARRAARRARRPTTRARRRATRASRSGSRATGRAARARWCALRGCDGASAAQGEGATASGACARVFHHGATASAYRTGAARPRRRRAPWPRASGRPSINS